MSRASMRDPCRLLVVDDERNMRDVLQELLEREGYAVETAEDAHQGLEKLRTLRFAAVLSDLRMPGMDGLEFLDQALRHCPDRPFVLLTAHGTVENAVVAMRRGAFDFVTKPFDREELLSVVERATGSYSKGAREVHVAHRALEALVGRSAVMDSLRRKIERIAPTPSSVLLLGETGTGKELVARALHELSPRSGGPWIATNCAAIPETLVEAELFGHEKGAFSGAVTARPGRFELADGGTLFLDEIGDMSLDVQPKVLRAIEQREVERVGSGKPRSVDVRFVAATHPGLLQRVERGEFRRDLYYRVSVLVLELPPLRARREDVPELVEHFRIKHSARIGIEVSPAAPELLRVLGRYDYPGNVRELENLVESLVVLSEGGRMRVQDLPATVSNFEDPVIESESDAATAANAETSSNLKDRVRGAVERLERQWIQDALQENKGNVTHTARAIGLSRKGLQLKMREYGLGRSCTDPGGPSDE